MTYFLVLSLGHFIADFIFQSRSVAEGKRSHDKQTRHKALTKHVCIHFIIYCILVVSWFVWQQSVNLFLFVAIAIVCIIHYGIDLAKLKLDDKLRSQMAKAATYTGDQLLHVLVIALTLTTFGMINLTLFDWLKGCYHLLFEGVHLSPGDKVLALAILTVVNTYGIAYLLEKLLQDIKPSEQTTDLHKQEQEIIETVDGGENKSKVLTTTKITHEYAEPENSIGKYIGMLERLLIMILLVNNAITSITILIAVKSLTRFKQFDDKSFAEYYLIGTLLSLLFGISAGFLALRVL